MSFTASAVRSLEIEITSECNATCPLCARFDHPNLWGKVREGEAWITDDLPVVSLTADDMRAILPRRFLRQISDITFCGCHGDPIMAPDFIDTVSYLHAMSPNVAIGINTNGGARSADWWTALAPFFRQANRFVTFGIDGFEDTHQLYRGTRYDITMRNVEAFMAAGGRAKWKFVTFRHNEHQVEAARELAAKMGFIDFIQVITYRMPGDTTTGTPVLRKGKRSHFLHAPTNTQQAPAGELMGLSDHVYEDIEHLHKLTCLSQKEGYLYIDFLGRVWPCPYTSGASHNSRVPDHPNLHETLKALGSDINDGRVRPIEDIIAGAMFKTINDRIESNNPFRCCARMCGE